MHPSARRLLVGLLFAAACQHPEAGPAAISTSAGRGVSKYVNVFVGTDDTKTVANPVVNGLGGSTYPAATAPFGMVQWGPDTPSASPPGYKYSDTNIAGFSLTHLNGAGCPAQRDFPVIPVTGDYDTSKTILLPFKHDNEIASPGFYEVKLDSGITVDLTATQRSGMARFTFPQVAEAHLLIRNAVDWDLVSTQDADQEIVSPTLITGSRLDSFCAAGKSTRVYFAARFDRPFTASPWGDSSDAGDKVTGLPGGLALTFDAGQNRLVHMKVGVSYVSVAGALANLDAENPAWDFNAIHAKTLASWDGYLGRLNVQGGSDEQKQLFYSALYHVFVQPAVFSDVDGSYFGFDQQPHPSDGHVHYANFSGWDIYRSWIQLVALLAPNETSDIVRSLLLDGQQCGTMPQWAYGASETAVMIGDPADPIVANAWAFGARDFDPQVALALMKHGATEAGAKCGGLTTRPGLADYLNFHFCPADVPNPTRGTVAVTMEYAIADAAIARFAQAQGDTASAQEYTLRGKYWRNVFDGTRRDGDFTGFVQPRSSVDVNGAPAFFAADVSSSGPVVEGSVSQYTFLVPQDLAGLIIAMGGDASFITRLDDHLKEVNSGTHGPYLYIGNEPGFGTPWEYPFAGAPWKTQEAIHRIVGTAFSVTPGGLPGNEDLGAMSSWLVWGMLGMYPEVPGVGGFVLASPTFPRVDVTLPGQKVFSILADGVTPAAFYIQAGSLNGAALNVPWVSYDDMKGGGSLELNMTNVPNTSWGAAPVNRPQAYIR
jgi:predicted alpha-1,2-mannosidase